MNKIEKKKRADIILSKVYILVQDQKCWLEGGFNNIIVCNNFSKDETDQ